MNDQQIKDFLTKHPDAPKAPVQEYQLILNRIENASFLNRLVNFIKAFRLNYAVPAFACALLLIFAIQTRVPHLTGEENAALMMELDQVASFFGDENVDLETNDAGEDWNLLGLALEEEHENS